MDYMGSEVIDGITYYHYQKTGDFYRNANTRGIQMGDRLEFEVSQFSAPGITNGQLNYYGTVFLYIVGEGIVPWYAKTGDEASEKIPEEYWLGGDTTIHYQYSDELIVRRTQAIALGPRSNRNIALTGATLGL